MTDRSSLIRALAAELGITEVEVRKHLADAVRAGLLAVEDHTTEPSMAYLVARFPRRVRMTAAACDVCAGWIEQTNTRFPGFCSVECRDYDRAVRDAIASDRAQRRRDAQQHRRATEGRRRINYLT